MVSTVRAMHRVLAGVADTVGKVRRSSLLKTHHLPPLDLLLLGLCLGQLLLFSLPLLFLTLERYSQRKKVITRDRITAFLRIQL